LNGSAPPGLTTTQMSSTPDARHSSMMI
jgi:hypothetical protein